MFVDARATAERIVWMVGCWELRVLFPRDHQPCTCTMDSAGLQAYKPKVTAHLALPDSGDGTM